MAARQHVQQREVRQTATRTSCPLGLPEELAAVVEDEKAQKVLSELQARRFRCPSSLSRRINFNNFTQFRVQSLAETAKAMPRSNHVLVRSSLRM